MPRGFLVKRSKKSPVSYRSREANNEAAEFSLDAHSLLLAAMQRNGTAAAAVHMIGSTKAGPETPATDSGYSDDCSGSPSPRSNVTSPFAPPPPPPPPPPPTAVTSFQHVFAPMSPMPQPSPPIGFFSLSPGTAALKPPPPQAPSVKQHLSPYQQQYQNHHHQQQQLCRPLAPTTAGVKRQQQQQQQQQVGPFTPEKKPRSKKSKTARRLNFSDDDKSPVHGTIIKPDPLPNKENDVDSTSTHSGQPPAMGEFVCQLCKERYGDPLSLAQHKCSRIVHVEYRCPECDKVFNCPANLASHRRWHKPRQSTTPTPSLGSPLPTKSVVSANKRLEDCEKEKGAKSSMGGQFGCKQCGKKFKRQACLRKHVVNSHHSAENMKVSGEATAAAAAYPCQYCGKIFRNVSCRAKHVLSHSAIVPSEALPLIGSAAEATTTSSAVTCGTTGNENFECKYCDEAFVTSPGLTRHINKCHPSENRQVIYLQPLPTVVQ